MLFFEDITYSTATTCAGHKQSLASQFFRSFLSIANAVMDNFVVEDEEEKRRQRNQGFRAVATRPCMLVMRHFNASEIEDEHQFT